MLKRTLLISLFVACFPCLLFADTRAGFPQGSVWLSNTALTAGDKATVHAVIYNSTQATLQGTLTFEADKKPLNTQQVSLAAGASQIYSTSWQATEGTHVFSAHLSGNTISDVAPDAGSVSITVAAPPAPSATQQTISQTTNVINTVASTSLPILTQVGNTIYKSTESLRQKGLALVQKRSGQIDSGDGAVLGTTTTRTAPSILTTPQKSSGIMASIYAVLIKVFASRAIFYPVFLLLIVFILWRLIKWVNKPRF